MAATNRTVYAILGLLAQGPKTGYEIKQVVEKTISHFWKESYGHLYPTLARLVEEGLVTREPGETQRAQTRQRYHLTAVGWEALSAWLAAPVEHEGTRNELALKLFFGQAVPPSVSRTHLEAHRDQQGALLARFHTDRAELEQQCAAGMLQAHYELVTLLLGIHIAEARIAWCDAALRLLKDTEEAPSTKRAACVS